MEELRLDDDDYDDDDDDGSYDNYDDCQRQGLYLWAALTVPSEAENILACKCLCHWR